MALPYVFELLNSHSPLLDSMLTSGAHAVLSLLFGGTKLPSMKLSRLCELSLGSSFLRYRGCTLPQGQSGTGHH